MRRRYFVLRYKGCANRMCVSLCNEGCCLIYMGIKRKKEKRRERGEEREEEEGEGLTVECG